MKAGIIGTGSIGSAVATGLARAGHDVTVSRWGVQSASLAAAFPILRWLKINPCLIRAR